MLKTTSAARFDPPTATAAATAFGNARADDADRILNTQPLVGYVDIFGYSSAAGGWLFNGWIPRPAQLDVFEPIEITAQYEQSHCTGVAIVAFYRREDLDDKSMGIIAVVASGSRISGALEHITFRLEGREYQARSGDFTSRLLDQEIVDRVRQNLLHQGMAGRGRDHILAITARRGFSGQDTLPTLSEPVLLEVDQTIFCPPAGLLLKGWLVTSAGTVRRLRVRSGPLVGDINASRMIRVNRPDVIRALGADHGFTQPLCGFVTFVPGVVSSGDALYLEVEIENGEVGFKPLKLSKVAGIEAMKQVLLGLEFRYGNVDLMFDATVGPAIASLNDARLAVAPAVEPRQFGVPPQDPVCTLVIPLHGRIDFLEYQMAIFSGQSRATPLEILYVLDDPSKQHELQALADSTHERFRVPFRLLLLHENVGFSPANNIGLRSATGRYVCFMNSDVFPITDAWLETMITALEENPDIAVLGARLLFEDGSVQHEGCRYTALSEFGNWRFIDHVNKGQRPVLSRHIERHAAVTGACMLMSREHAERVGGFDEAFIVGDFEDSDLCLKTKALGLECAVHMAVEMYHLERKSQVSPSESWRMNLTLYNAWVHQRRWFGESSLADPGAAVFSP
jgi:GT2 family glycosyltransferase